MTKCVIFTLRMPGFHRWKDAPTKWGYLSNWHRHEFHIKCKIGVNTNRQEEIIDMKEDLHQFLLDVIGLNNVVSTDLKLECPLDYHNYIVLPGDGSCENLASYIAGALTHRYETEVIVTVLEDGENGASVGKRYEP